MGVISKRIKDKETNKTKLVTNEIDFIAYKGNNRCNIQVATTLGQKDSDTYIREIKPLLKLNDGGKKIVITSDNVPPSYNDQGIFIINIIDFLLNKESI